MSTASTIPEVRKKFNSLSIKNRKALIRGAQADRARYPEFVKRSTAAGLIGYWAFLTGKRVTYFGRKGEQHIEEFPKPKV
jgi:uncharacterized protein YbcV (DUF1398 family)